MQKQIGYFKEWLPSCSPVEETVVMRGLLWYYRSLIIA